MSKSVKRGIKTHQIGMRLLHLKIQDTATTPVAEGPDKFLVASIVDNGGVGDFTVILNRPAANDKDLYVAGWSGPADTAVAVTNVDHDRVTVLITDLAGAAKDEDVFLTILAHDARYEI